MPDPKKKKKAPANAATDTGTKSTPNRPTSRARRVTDNGKGVSKSEATGAGESVVDTEKLGQTQGYHRHYYDSETGKSYYPGQMQSLVSASGGKGGRVSRDPFLEGFNSDDTFTGRRKGSRRK